LLGAAAAALVAGFSWRLLGTSPTEPLPDSGVWAVQLARPEGGELALSSLRGKPLVLNFWATWCAPCLKELPDLERFYQQHTQLGWQVVGIAVDAPSAVRSFIARQPLSFPVGLAGLEGSELGKQLGNQAGTLPFTVVFDRTGRIRHRKSGLSSLDEMNAWVKSA
jgi:hypothetical protein